MATLLLASALALAIGAVLGMFGGGGAILAVPMFVYALHVEPKAAIAMSLFVIGATSVAAAIVHARCGTVRFRIGSIFGVAAMVGAYGGGRLAQRIPGALLLVLFSVVMLVTALAMLRGRSSENGARRTLAVHATLGLGASVGAISGLVGTGGGFLIVPALTLLGGLPVRDAIGTSLFVIALQSFAGFAGHMDHVTLDPTLLAWVTPASIVGTVAGALVGRRLPTELLRRAFAWLVLLLALLVISKQLPPLASAVVAVVTLGIVVALRRAAATR